MKRGIHTHTMDLRSQSKAASKVKRQNREVLETCLRLSLEESVFTYLVIKILLFWSTLVDGKEKCLQWLKELQFQQYLSYDTLSLSENVSERRDRLKRIREGVEQSPIWAFCHKLLYQDLHSNIADKIHKTQQKHLSQSEVLHGATCLNFYCTLII